MPCDVLKRFGFTVKSLLLPGGVAQGPAYGFIWGLSRDWYNDPLPHSHLSTSELCWKVAFTDGAAAISA